MADLAGLGVSNFRGRFTPIIFTVVLGSQITAAAALNHCCSGSKTDAAAQLARSDIPLKQKATYVRLQRHNRLFDVKGLVLTSKGLVLTSKGLALTSGLRIDVKGISIDVKGISIDVKGMY